MFWWLAKRLSIVFLFERYTQKRPLDTREAYVMSFGEINLERAIRYSICGIFSIVLNTIANSLFGSCSEATFDAKLGVFVLYVGMD